MKYCVKCKCMKAKTDFGKDPRSPTGLRSYCKSCNVARATQRKQELIARYRELKTGLSCSNCTEDHWATLDFHHIDPTTKINSVSDMVCAGNSFAKIKDEIAKCIVLCANCHRKIHCEELNTNGR